MPNTKIQIIILINEVHTEKGTYHTNTPVLGTDETSSDTRI